MNKIQQQAGGLAATAEVQPLGWGQTLFSILASVAGVQSWSRFERDTSRGSPRRYMIVLAGLLLGFVMLHVWVVRLVLRHAGVE